MNNAETQTKVGVEPPSCHIILVYFTNTAAADAAADADTDADATVPNRPLQPLTSSLSLYLCASTCKCVRFYVPPPDT